MDKAIIVGATSGIGKGIAKILADNNYKVGITGRRTELLTELKNENVECFFEKTLNVLDTIETVKKLEELIIELGGLDMLIISSGIGDINEELDFQIEKRSIDTNVSGFTAIVCWAFNYFQRQKHGHLIAISSIAGLRGNRQAPAYNATKAYQINYLEGLIQKVAKTKTNVTITDIRPGFVDTVMAKGSGKFWVSSVETAAKQIFIAIKRKKKIAYITKRWRLIALFLKILPLYLYRYF